MFRPKMSARKTLRKTRSNPQQKSQYTPAKRERQVLAFEKSLPLKCGRPAQSEPGKSPRTKKTRANAEGGEGRLRTHDTGRSLPDFRQVARGSSDRFLHGTTVGLDGR